MRGFRDRLRDLGVNATVRRNRGTDIDAACGQLAATSAPPRRSHRQRTNGDVLVGADAREEAFVLLDERTGPHDRLGDLALDHRTGTDDAAASRLEQVGREIAARASRSRGTAPRLA